MGKPGYTLGVLSAGLLLGACDGPRRSEWLTVAQAKPAANEPKLPELLPDSALKGFLPAKLGDRVGRSPTGAMTRMGDRALSEASRAYAEGGVGEPGVELKLADARLEPAATQAIRTFAGEGDALAERVVLPGAIGYARYDEGDRVAQAQVLIAGRFIASATVEQADDAEEATRALSALDTLAIARLAQAPR
jgi:hypothetical protein